MAILVQHSAGVYFREINLSQTLVQQSSANAGLVFISNQGREGLFHTTDGAQFQTEYGTRNPAVSFGHYVAQDFLLEGNSLWNLRVLGSGYAYSAAILKLTSGSATAVAGINAGIQLAFSNGTVAPTNAWSTYVSGGETPIVLFYPKHGPGSYGNAVQVAVRSDNLPAPATPVLNSSSTGGTLTAATYAYKVSAISKYQVNGVNAESLASTEAQVVVSSGSTNSIAVTWTAVPGAIGYNIYGRSAGTEHLITSVGGLTLSWTDTGALTPGSQLPITNAGNLVLTNVFHVDVYDTTWSSAVPRETFDVTLTPQVDASGVQQEISQRINPFSQYINVINNTPALVGVPGLSTWLSPVNLAGGTSGTAPNNSAIQTAWTTYFSDTEQVNVDILINGGVYDVGVQKNLDTIATGRGTAVALIDVPPQNQSSAQAMIDYRNLTLNLNSSFSALFGPDVLESDPDNGQSQRVPFSGWAAALCARTDRVANPWFSIAGLNRGLLNVLGVYFPGTNVAGFNQGDRDALFAAQVNYTRKFVGAGIALWEQMTLAAQPSALQWLSVRRMVNVIKKSVYLFLLYSVHEPNDDFSRKAIVSGIGGYLDIIKNARGISAYSVVSNDTNNPPQLYNAGILKVTVFITPIIPIHEIQVDLVITKQGVTFSEINIQNII